MDTTKLELGIIGDFLTGSFSAHPSPLKGEEGLGLRPEHFSDPSARTAFEPIAAADLQDQDRGGRARSACRGFRPKPEVDLTPQPIFAII